MATACKEIAEGQSKVGEDATVITSNLDHPIGICLSALGFMMKNLKLQWTMIYASEYLT